MKSILSFILLVLSFTCLAQQATIKLYVGAGSTQSTIYAIGTSMETGDTIYPLVVNDQLIGDKIIWSSTKQEQDLATLNLKIAALESKLKALESSIVINQGLTKEEVEFIISNTNFQIRIE